MRWTSIPTPGEIDGRRCHLGEASPTTPFDSGVHSHRGAVSAAATMREHERGRGFGGGWWCPWWCHVGSDTGRGFFYDTIFFEGDLTQQYTWVIHHQEKMILHRHIRFAEVPIDIGQIYKYVHTPTGENIMCMTMIPLTHPWPIHIKTSTHHERNPTRRRSDVRERYISVHVVVPPKEQASQSPLNRHYTLSKPVSMQRRYNVFFRLLLLLLLEVYIKEIHVQKWHVALDGWMWGIGASWIATCLNFPLPPKPG